MKRRVIEGPLKVIGRGWKGLALRTAWIEAWSSTSFPEFLSSETSLASPFERIRNTTIASPFSPFRAASGIEAYHFLRTSLTKTLRYGLKSTPLVGVRICTLFWEALVA